MTINRRLTNSEIAVRVTFLKTNAYVSSRLISLNYFNAEARYEKGLDLLSKLTPVQYSIYVSAPRVSYHQHMQGEVDLFISAVPVELGAVRDRGIAYICR